MRRRDDVKTVTGLVLDAARAFPACDVHEDLDAFCATAELAADQSDWFYDPPAPLSEVTVDDQWVRFRSSISTGVAENDIVHAKVTRAKSRGHAVIVFHHWNATARNASLARYLSRQGITVVEMALPYHLERSRPSSLYADDMLSTNLGKTLQSVRQAVVDGRQLISVLKHAGYGRVSVLGISLGSWVAGLVAAHDPAVEKACLLLSAGSLADMVWTGGATEHIRAGLEGKIELAQLRRAWSPLDLGSHVTKLSRPGLCLQMVLAKRDRVVLPGLSDAFVHQLREAGSSPQVKRLNCGHYSLTLPPYAISTGLGIARFLKDEMQGPSREGDRLNPA
jgi:dienelactone hydrolase